MKNDKIDSAEKALKAVKQGYRALVDVQYSLRRGRALQYVPEEHNVYFGAKRLRVFDRAVRIVANRAAFFQPDGRMLNSPCSVDLTP